MILLMFRGGQSGVSPTVEAGARPQGIPDAYRRP